MANNWNITTLDNYVVSMTLEPKFTNLSKIIYECKVDHRGKIGAKFSRFVEPCQKGFVFSFPHEE